MERSEIYPHCMRGSIICHVEGRVTLPKPTSSSELVKNSSKGLEELNSLFFGWIINLLSFLTMIMTSTREMYHDAEILYAVHGLSVS